MGIKVRPLCEPHSRLSIKRGCMGMNKSKLRREKKKPVQPQPEASPNEPKRLIEGWVLRFIIMIPPVLYACYLAWDHGKQ